MKVILWPRRAGRTSRLIEMVVANSGVMVCVNAQRAQVARDLARKLHPKIDPTFWDAHIIAFSPDRARGLSPRVHWFVDDADDLLESLLGRPITAISVTDDSR